MSNEDDSLEHTAEHLSGKTRVQRPKFSWKVWLIWFAIFAVLPSLALVEEYSKGKLDLPPLLVMLPLMGVVGATFYYGGYVMLRRLIFKMTVRDVAAASIEKRKESLQEDLEQDFFNNLVKINFKYIDKYYLQTQIQADKAFTMSAIAAFVGFAVLVAGVVQMYVGKVEAAYVTTASGVVSEFIAAIFFYLYNRTILRMSEYHRKLVLTQNVGLALRITQDLPNEQRVASQSALVERLSADINNLLATPAKDS
jgi:hypothetical protein